MSRINIDSNLWGPKAWFFLDTLVLSYPNNPTPDDMKEFKKFFMSLENMLPCEKCRIHYGDYLAKNPLTNKILISKKKLVAWVLECHNSVKRLQNKDQIKLNDFNNYYIKELNLEIDKESSDVKSKHIEKFSNSFYVPNYFTLMTVICLAIILILVVLKQKIKF